MNSSIRTNRLPLVAAALALAGILAAMPSPAAAATVTWAGGDGTWDFAPGEWASGASFVNGDTAVFDGAQGSNRSRTNLITVDAGGVSPAAVQATGGFSGKFRFLGGDILTGSVTSNNITSELEFYGNGSYSFGGGLTSVALVTYAPQLTAANQTLQLGSGSISAAAFYFLPTQAGTKLNNTINLTGRSNTNFWSNANVDWSGTTVNVTGANPINLGEGSGVNAAIPFVTNNLTMTLLNNAQFRMNWRAQTGFTQPPAFTGVVNGAYTLTTFVDTGWAGFSRIAGAGNWGIAGLTKTGGGVLRLEAPEVVGDVLRIDAGSIAVGTGRTQTVKELWLGGVQQTVQGTYGRTGSGATFTNDTYFSAPSGFNGVIVLVPEPSSVGLLLAAGTLVGLIGRRMRRG